jgi:NAD(P)H-hydrate epimerase
LVKPVLTAAEYSRVDAAYPGDMTQAMERAGHAVALAAARHGASYGRRVVVLTGPGNNGGDGYVAARLLSGRGVDVVVQRLGEPKTDLAISAATRGRQQGVRIVDIGEPRDCALVVDALFGGGVRGGLPAEVLGWMDTVSPVVAVDFPTGLDPDTGEVEERAFRAVETVTFSALKTGHVSGGGPDHCGLVTVADIGIGGGVPSMYVAEVSDALRPARERTAHKWSSGSVLIVGGSAGMAGAAVLAARAALSFGAGSVYTASTDPAGTHALASQIPGIDHANAEARLDRFDVVVVGPGLAVSDVEGVRPLVAKASRVVLDAGGLVPELVEAARDGGSSVIATPHAAEFRRIAGVGGGKYSIRSMANRYGLTLLYKGNPTMVTDGGPPILVTTGGPELASIGTGDVLSGMVAALWARGLEPLDAAVSGAYWHGVAGADLASDRAVTADALADHVARFAW